MLVGTSFRSVMQSGEHGSGKATCDVTPLGWAPNQHVASHLTSRFCTSFPTTYQLQRLASFWLKSAVFQSMQVSLALLYNLGDNHMHRRTCMHESSSSEKGANATCETVTVDWSVAARRDDRYSFLRDLGVGHSVFVANGDDRIRSAAAWVGRRYGKQFSSARRDSGPVVERLA